MMTTTTSPASLAEIAAGLIDEYQKESANGVDRRKHPRHEYECSQLVAEFDGEKLPLQRDFELFEFHDISAGGISFLVKERPLSNDLVIALGRVPFVFFHVEIVCTVPLEEHPKLKIGCRFVARI